MYVIWLKFNIKVRLHDQFQQTWREKLQNCSKTLSYRIFKETFIFKQYFYILGEKDFLALCVSQIYEKPYSSKIVCTLFNQEEIAFCVLRKWYTKQCTTGKFLTVFLFYVWSSMPPSPVLYLFEEGSTPLHHELHNLELKIWYKS
jgi:hypothetical protein